MREILFRGKRISDDTWVEGGIYQTFHPNFNCDSEKDYYCQKPNCYAICANGRDVFVWQHTIGQYTGLIDKNGKKIFEGDIVKTENDELPFVPDCYKGKIGTVVFEKCDCIIHFSDGLEEFLSSFENDIEVIGNIYDSPELLEVRE